MATTYSTLKKSVVAGLLVCYANPVQAEFDDIAFTQRNFNSYTDLDEQFVCHANIINRAVTGCTVLQTADTSDYDEDNTDWQNKCLREMNAWNRDPSSTLANVVLKQPGSGTFGCTLKTCDGNDPNDYGVSGSEDGRRSAVVPSNFYCGRPPAGMVTAFGTTVAADMSSNPSSNIALLERGVERIYSTQYFNNGQVTTYCAHRLDTSAVCWGNADLSGVDLSGIASMAASRAAFAFLKTNGNVVTGGPAALGGDVTDPKASNGLNTAVACTVNGGCLALQTDGSAYIWGASEGALPTTVSQAGSDIRKMYTNFRGVVFQKSDHSLVAYGNAQYGGSPPTTGIMDKNITKVLNEFNWYGFAILANDGEADTWGLASFTNTDAIDQHLDSGVVDIVSTSTGYVFLKDDNTAYASPRPVVDIAIANVASIWGGYIANSFATIHLDGTVTAHGTLSGTISDGTTYVSCTSSKDNIICLNTAGKATKLAGDYAVPVEAESGVIKLIGNAVSIGALKSTGEFIPIGDITATGSAAAEITEDVMAVNGATLSWAVVRGVAAPETQFPTVSPSVSPTTGPTSSPTTRPTTTPTRTPSNPGDTIAPTEIPTTGVPSISPTPSPTAAPTTSPTLNPTAAPSTATPTTLTPNPTTLIPTNAPAPKVCGCKATKVPTTSI